MVYTVFVIAKRVKCPLSFIPANFNKTKIPGNRTLSPSRGKNKKMENEKKCECPECQRRAEEEKAQEEMNFAILLALIPALVITFFNSAGLF